jgi:hypothetical protein
LSEDTVRSLAEALKCATLQLENQWIQTFYTDGTRVLGGENFSDIQRRAQDAVQSKAETVLETGKKA